MKRNGAIVRRRRLPARFPRHGSPEFVEKCSWTVDHGADAIVIASPANATSLTRSLVPWVANTEGLSAWVCAAAQAYIYSRLLARQQQALPPKLLLEYEGTNISEVVLQPDAKRTSPDWVAAPRTRNGAHDWCNDGPDCEIIDDKQPWDDELKRGAVPIYRLAYTFMKKHWIHEGDFDGLSQSIPGFSVETGMACALNSMWNLHPKLADHEPELFTKLLPGLREDGTLVLSLYLRTGWADMRRSNVTRVRTSSEMKTGLRNVYIWDQITDRQEWEKQAEEFLRPFVECAQNLEQEYFDSYSNEEGAAFSKIAWLVSSDSPLLKHYVRDAFGDRDAVLAPAGTNDTASTSVPRHIVFTGSVGMHTKSRGMNRKASGNRHAGLAQAFVDWYLLGESDAVIAKDGIFSFGTTAALRTARPVYVIPYIIPMQKSISGPVCSRQALVRPKQE